jgi:hypothetical protein
MTEPLVPLRRGILAGAVGLTMAAGFPTVDTNPRKHPKEESA